MPLVLASASPRRQELLKSAGIEFVVKPANIPEVRRDQETAQTFAERMAREKARAVFAEVKSEYVLGADTVVVFAGAAGGETGDQKRVVTPQRALEDGASVLVIGRPITGSADPVQAIRDIAAALSPTEEARIRA